ncbi:MAG: type II toxin-antitoxin system RelE/ParE family toxin [Solobacterium sp.]|nr:type II toxin-antitoxin system RelE/ParE family toxin [Solobacterium sp.]
MAYKIIVTERAAQQIDDVFSYIAVVLANPNAARSVRDELLTSYRKLEMNPFSAPPCNDLQLKALGFRRMKLKKHQYILIFKVCESDVIIYGFFHTLEDYSAKL